MITVNLINSPHLFPPFYNYPSLSLTNLFLLRICHSLQQILGGILLCGTVIKKYLAENDRNDKDDNTNFNMNDDLINIITR